MRIALRKHNANSTTENRIIWKLRHYQWTLTTALAWDLKSAPSYKLQKLRKTLKRKQHMMNNNYVITLLYWTENDHASNEQHLKACSCKQRFYITYRPMIGPSIERGSALATTASSVARLFTEVRNIVLGNLDGWHQNTSRCAWTLNCDRPWLRKDIREWR